MTTIIITSRDPRLTNVMLEELSAIKNVGVRGVIKSGYYSLRHTGRMESILMHSNVISNISSETTFSMNGRLQFGLRNPGASHPRSGRSVFTTESGAKVAHTGSKHAIIGPNSVVHVEGELSLGDVRMNSHIRIICGDRIDIGDRVDIAWDVVLLDDNRHQLVINGEEQPKTGSIVIGDDVWIGHNTSIGKGVTIGDGAVVASNSVVVDDVPEETLVAGCPAEPIAQGDLNWDY